MPLVGAIVHDPSFASTRARNTRVRTPVEKLVGLLQAFPTGTVDVGRIPRRAKANGTQMNGSGMAGAGANGANAGGVGQALRTIGYVPFVPPNVGGYPKGNRLLGPHQLIHAFDLLSVFPSPPRVPREVDALFARFGLYDVSGRSRNIVAAERDPARRLALVLASPEFTVA
jgi:hypothetical protein